jgi:RNA polymerase sigma-70 factor (sigma-E family)
MRRGWTIDIERRGGPVERGLDAFGEFVAARSSALLRTAVLLAGGDRQHGEDLLQDAFAETYRRWNRIASIDASEAYTRTILVRLATRRWRRGRYEPPLEAVDGPRPGAATFPDVDLGLDVERYLRALPARQRAVVVLRYFDDRTEAEIAQLLGCAPGTVKSHASRALAALREQLEGTAYAPTDAGRRSDDRRR